MRKQYVKVGSAVAAIVALLVLNVFPILTVPVANAAALTSVKDTLSTLASNTVANHTVLFVTPTGVDASTDTITIDLTGFTIGSVDYTDIDLAVDGDANCDGAWTDKTLAATPSTSPTWGAAIASSVLTLTAPTNAASGEITANRCVQIEIGTNATAGEAGNAQLTNPNNQNTLVVEIGGVFGDSKNFALDFVTDDSVNVTANVDPSITFSISDTTIGFGTLSATAAAWATGDAVGSASDVAAHTMALSTNAASGYAITYSGATLTSGSDTIDVASITNDADGTAGSEQFGMGFSTDGNATIAAAYDHNATAAQRDWAFVASTTTTVVSETVPTATETISAFYLANIAVTTQPGSYATNVTYIATGTF